MFKSQVLIALFLVLYAFQVESTSSVKCLMDSDCESIPNTVCDVRPPFPSSTCLYAYGGKCKSKLDCTNNLNCTGGTCGCMETFSYNQRRAQCVAHGIYHIGSFGSNCNTDADCTAEPNLVCRKRKDRLTNKCLLDIGGRCSNEYDCQSLNCVKGYCANK